MKCIEKETIQQGDSKNINTADELENYLLNKSANGLAYVKATVFDTVYIYGYKNPSSVPFYHIDSNDCIFYKGGKLEFSGSKKTAHQNSGITCE